ncbi:autophagy protein 16 [Mucor ambiguus]|uniref:Autophagy protein 16 n=1 Tax=Mucor ambiguus TaxID=91626 RepID=A0A0C9LUY5_9FUNG|nr:autophagy protein 16 [Mucor ambiguus]
MTFRDTLLERLQARDKAANSFHDIIVTNNRLLQQTIELEKKNKAIESAKNDGSNTETAGSTQRVAELDRRIRELNEERAEMYKTQSENAQRLVNLNEQLRTREEKDLKQTEEIKQLSDSVKKLSTKCDLQTQQLREKDVTIQILQDELAALQLEMVTTEDKISILRKENEQLLERWINKMNEEAEKMNEATQFYETALEQAKLDADRQKLKQSKKRDASSSVDLAKSIPFSNIVLPKKSTKRISVHDAEIHCIAASSTGTMFATGGADKKIKLFDAKTGNITHTLSGALQTITSVQFNSTDELVLGSCTDNATRIWSLATHRLKHTLTGHIGKVYAAKFTMDSNRVISGSHDRTLKVWDLQKGYNTRTIFTFSSCNDVCLMDPDGQTVISGHLDNNIRLWDARTGVGIKELTGIHSGQITSVSMSPDGTTLLTNSRDNTLKTVDVRMYDIVRSFQAETFRNGLNWSRSTFSPDGKYVAAGSADGSLHIWNAKTGKLERAIEDHSSVICGVSWNPNGDFLYTAEKNKVVCMWDTSTVARSSSGK